MPSSIASPPCLFYFINLFILRLHLSLKLEVTSWLDLLVRQPLESSCLAFLVLGLLQKTYLFLGNGVGMHRKNSFFMCLLMLPLQILFAQGMGATYRPRRSVLSRSSPQMLFPSMPIAAWREKCIQVKKKMGAWSYGPVTAQEQVNQLFFLS